MSYYIKKAWKINLLVCLIQLVWGTLYTLTNITMMWMADAIISKNFDAFIIRFLAHVSLWAIICVLNAVKSWAKSKAMLVMNNQVRADMVATMLRKDYNSLHSVQSGEYLSGLTNDINNIASNVWEPFFGIISVIAQILTSIFALYKVHYSLLLLSMAVALIMIYFPKIFESRIKELTQNYTNIQAESMNLMKEMIDGIDVLIFFNKREYFVKKCKNSSNNIELARHKLNYSKACISEGINFTSLLCQFVVFALIGLLAIKNLISSSVILGGGNLCGIVYNGLAAIGQLALSIKAGNVYFDKVTEHENIEQISYLYIPEINEGITIKKLSFGYGDKKILDNVNLKFCKNKKYAIIGKSGCGKSTMLKILMGIYRNYDGKIYLDQNEATVYSPEQIQNQLSYIDQNVFMFNTTIKENITLGEKFSDAQIELALKESALIDDIGKMPLGLDTNVGEAGKNLSGGQKQRVAIARALIHNKSILLIDEGTSALDNYNADIIEKNLLSNQNLTLIMVSHHLSDENKKKFDGIIDMEKFIA